MAAIGKKEPVKCGNSAEFLSEFWLPIYITDRSGGIKALFGVSLVLAEALLEQILDRLERFSCVIALGTHFHFHTFLRTEHHQTGHALGADLVLAPRDSDLRGEAPRGLRERRSRAKMEPEPVFDFYRRLRNIHALYDTGIRGSGKPDQQQSTDFAN